jgi:hypothetical protein
MPLNAPMINTPLSFIALHSVITSQHLKFLQSKTSDTFDHIILTVICAVKNLCTTKYSLGQQHYQILFKLLQSVASVEETSHKA